MRAPSAAATDDAAGRPSAAPASAAASAAVRADARSTAAPPIRPSNTIAPPAASTSSASSGTIDPFSPLRTSALLPQVAENLGEAELLFGVFDLEHRRGGGHRLILLQAHDAHAGGVASLRRDVACRHADGDARRRDQEQLVVETDHERGDDVAASSGELDALDAHRAPALTRETLELGALAVAGVGDDEDVDVVTRQVARHDLVALTKAHADDAGGRAAHRSHRLLGEADGLPHAADHEDVVFAAGLDDLDELVLVLEVDGDDAVAPGLVVLVHQRLLDLALLGREEEVAAVLVGAGVDDGGDLLVGRQRQQVDDGGATRRAVL